MLSARPLARTALPRAARSARQSQIQQIRQQSSTSSASSTSSGSGGSHLATGIAGGVAGAATLYGIYLVTPAGRMSSKINSTAKEANKKYQAAASKLKEKTPDSDQAIDSIKQFAYSYVAWIPGGREYVDTAFKDLETVRQNHREEADEIVNDAYRQFQEISKLGLSYEALTKAYEVLRDLSGKIGNLAGDAIFDILDNHPQVKEKFGGSIDQLKQMGEQYGPEAKKEVDETWKQVKEVMAGGVSASTLDKARRLIEEKVEKVRKLGDEAWKKGLEQAKPYLEKNPKIKELVENNADALKKGNAKELFEKAKAAVESGDLGNLEEYVNKTVEKAKSKGAEFGGSWGNLSQYLKAVPQGSEILPKLQQLGEIAEKHRGDGEKLLKETIDELREVLEKKSQKAQEIVNRAKKDAK